MRTVLILLMFVLTAPVSSSAAASVRFADQFPGADAGAKINAAIASLPSTGGTVDARGFTGNVSFATPVIVGGPSKPVQLLFDPATTFTYTGAGAAFTIATSAHRSRIEGLTLACSGANSLDGVLVNGAWFWTLERLSIDGCKHSGLYITNASGVGNYLFSVKDSRIGNDPNNRNGTAILLESVNSSGITFGQFYNTYAAYAATDGFSIKAGVGKPVTGMQIIGGGGSYNLRHGIWIEGMADIVITSSDFESNGYVADPATGAAQWKSSGLGGWGLATDGNPISISLNGAVFSGNQAGDFQRNAKKTDIDMNGVREISSTQTTAPVDGVSIRLLNGLNTVGADSYTVPLSLRLAGFGDYHVEGSKTVFDFPVVRFSNPDRSQWFGWQADSLNRLWFFNGRTNLVLAPNWGSYAAGGTASVTLPPRQSSTLVSLEGDQTFTGKGTFKGGVAIPTAGSGVLVKSPDGSICKTIGIDNTGAIVATAARCP